MKGYILFELNSIALKFVHIGFLSRQRQYIRKRKVQSVPNATISPFSRKIRKEELKRKIFFYSSFSLPFQISSSNLAETSTSPLPPPFLYLNAQIKSKSFLKIRDLIAQYHCSSGSSLSALIRSQIRAFHCSKIKKPGGIKKPRSKVKIILMPSYLHLRISIVILRK